MNVAAECAVLFPVSYPPIIEALRPDLACESNFFLCSKGKPAFDELQRPLQAQSWREQQVKMIGHQDKFMEEIFLLSAVAKQDVHKQIGHPVGLKQTVFLEGGGSDEVSAVSSVASVWSGHEPDLSG